MEESGKINYRIEKLDFTIKLTDLEKEIGEIPKENLRFSLRHETEEEKSIDSSFPAGIPVETSYSDGLYKGNPQYSPGIKCAHPMWITNFTMGPKGFLALRRKRIFRLQRSFVGKIINPLKTFSQAKEGKIIEEGELYFHDNAVVSFKNNMTLYNTPYSSIENKILEKAIFNTGFSMDCSSNYILAFIELCKKYNGLIRIFVTAPDEQFVVTNESSFKDEKIMEHWSLLKDEVI